MKNSFVSDVDSEIIKNMFKNPNIKLYPNEVWEKFNTTEKMKILDDVKIQKKIKNKRNILRKKRKKSKK